MISILSALFSLTHTILCHTKTLDIIRNFVATRDFDQFVSFENSPVVQRHSKISLTAGRDERSGHGISGYHSPSRADSVFHASWLHGRDPTINCACFKQLNGQPWRETGWQNSPYGNVCRLAGWPAETRRVMSAFLNGTLKKQWGKKRAGFLSLTLALRLKFYFRRGQLFAGPAAPAEENNAPSTHHAAAKSSFYFFLSTHTMGAGFLLLPSLAPSFFRNQRLLALKKERKEGGRSVRRTSSFSSSPLLAALTYRCLANDRTRTV